jgi:hypothetical protein
MSASDVYAVPDLPGGSGPWAGLSAVWSSVSTFAMSVWPSTPSGLLPSHLFSGLQTAFPMAPWYLLPGYLTVVAFVLLFIAIRKWFSFWLDALFKILQVLQIVSLFRSLFVLFRFLATLLEAI